MVNLDIKKLIVLLVTILITSVLLVFSWPPFKFPYLIFISFIPVLYIVDCDYLDNGKKILLIYLVFILFNIGTTYWIYKLNVFGGIILHLLNPGIQIIPFIIILILEKKINSKIVRYILFSSAWLSIEYFHFHWFIKFPFLNLGNVFSTMPKMIQWYQYTGILGGTIWILIVNVLIYELVLEFLKENQFKLSIPLLITVFVLISFPILSSYLSILNSKVTIKEEINVLAIHTSINCREEKYILNPHELINSYLETTMDGLTHETDYIVWPENAIPDLGWVSGFGDNEYLKTISAKLRDYPKAKLITGGILYELAPENHERADFSERLNQWYYTYNGVIQVDFKRNRVEYRTKEKLVPFEEENPFPSISSFTRRLFGSLGGFNFTSRKVNNPLFESESKKDILTIICYELLFGEHVSKLVNNQASAIFILLNEGWYKNTTAARQFMYYSSLRAIETQKPIVRSSNDGISCFINRFGEITAQVNTHSNTIINEKICLNNNRTFYMFAGDYLGIASIVIMSICLLLTLRIRV